MKMKQEMLEDEQKRSGRRRKTRIHDKLMKTISDNLLASLGDKTYDDVADYVEITKSSVRSWVEKKYLPSVEQLVLTAQILNRDPGWFLVNHSFEDSKKAIITYADAYRILRPLSSMNLIKADSIQDYFLRYLLKRSEELDSRQNIPPEKLDLWYHNIITKFSVPIMPPLDADMYQWLETIHGDIDPEDTVAAVLLAVRDYYDGKNTDDINKKFLEWKCEQHPGEVIFPDDEDELPMEFIDKTFPPKIE